MIDSIHLGDSCLALGEKLQLEEGKWSRELTLGLGTRHQPNDVLKAKFHKVETDTYSMVRTLQTYVH